MANTVPKIDEILNSAYSIKSSNPEKLSRLLDELNSLSEQMTTQQSYYLQYLEAYRLTFMGKSSESIPIFQSILNSNADDITKFRSRVTIINVFAYDKNWPEGLSHLTALLNQLDDINHIESHQNGLALASMFYNQLGQYSLGKIYAEKLASEAIQKRQICMGEMFGYEAKLNLGELTVNNTDIHKAVAACKDEPIAASLLRSYLAELHLRDNNYTESLNLLLPFLSQTEATKYPRVIARVYSLLANAYWLKNDAKLAKEYALTALKHSKHRSTNMAKVLSYKLLFEVYKSQGNLDLALLYHQKYAIADKLYYDEMQVKHLAVQLAEHKAIEQKGQIDLLNNKNKLLTAEKALINANVENTRLIIMVLVLTLLVLTFWGYRLLKAHKRIKELAEHDALTGILNRGHFTQIANNALKYCQSAGQELSLIMFDLDYFKSINDNYGHACGDWALKKTVDVCKSLGRKNDVFARLGGEEFCILLTSCDKQAALLRAEAFREAIADINSDDSGFEFTITASFGITDTKTSGFDLEKLLADADSATYKAKHIGRNQTNVFHRKNTTAKIIQLDTSRDF